MSSTRRDFLLTAGVAGMAAPLAAQVRAKSANDRVQIALIGAGGMGTEDALSSLSQEGVADCRRIRRV